MERSEAELKVWQGQQLARWRTEKRWTQGYVGRCVGEMTDRETAYTSAAVSNWERGEDTPSNDAVRALDDLFKTGGELADVFGVSMLGGLKLAQILDRIERRLDDLEQGQRERRGDG